MIRVFRGLFRVCSMEKNQCPPCAPWIIQSALRGLHILHRQTLVFNIEFLEFTCSLKEMLSFIF